MYKIIALFFLQVFMLAGVYAKEPTLGILQNVYSNTLQQLSLDNSYFYCKAYGVVSLEEIYANQQTDTGCKEAIKTLYIQEPLLQYFSAMLLKKKQRYHIELKQQGCLLYAKGQNTLSELLLKNGLALLRENFADREFDYAFYKAQRYAKSMKKGIWGDLFVAECGAWTKSEESK